MMDYRENAGYIITDSCHVGDSEFVLGVHLTAPQQFVTWKCSNRTDYDWGHYFSDLFSAQKDLVARAQEEVQCLEDQRQNTIVPEAPSYSPWGNKGEELAHENYSFYNYGSYNSQYHELFLSGRFELVEGTHITDDMAGSIIISRELAEWNGLKVGDTLTGVYYPQNNTPEVDMKIVGIFDVVADKNDQVNMYDDASYYAYSSYVFCSMDAAEGLIKGWGEDGEGISEAYYYVTDAAQLENVIREVQSISSINWNNYKITANDEVYQNISSALSDTGTLITTLIVVITAVSMVLIILILSMSIRSRKRETGILLAVGIAKPAVILQYVLETLLIAVVAFPLAYLSSKQVAGTLGTLFGKAAENVIVTPEHFMLVAIVGGVLLVAAVLVSSISTMRLKPKQILSQME